jgi:hypothetical protein
MSLQDLFHAMHCIALAWVVSSLAPPALAAAPVSTTVEAEVRRLVEAAQAHRTAGRHDEAVASLEAALALHPAHWIAFNIGRVNENAGRRDLARRHFEVAAGVEDDAETRRKALDGIRRVDDQGPRGVLQLAVRTSAGSAPGAAGTPSTIPPGAVRIDGITWPPRLGRTFNLSRGAHVVEVIAEGMAPWSRTIEVEALTSVEVLLAPPDAPSASPEPPPVMAAGEAPASPSTEPAPQLAESKAQLPGEPRLAAVHPGEAGLHTRLQPAPAGSAWPWALTGLGGAVALAGGVYLVGWQLDWQKVRDGEGVTFRDEAEALVASGREKRDVGIALTAVGGGVALGGLLWGLLQDSPAPAVSVGLLGPGTPGLTVGGRL